MTFSEYMNFTINIFFVCPLKWLILEFDTHVFPDHAWNAVVSIWYGMTFFSKENRWVWMICFEIRHLVTEWETSQRVNCKHFSCKNVSENLIPWFINWFGIKIRVWKCWKNFLEILISESGFSSENTIDLWPFWRQKCNNSFISVIDGNSARLV